MHGIFRTILFLGSLFHLHAASDIAWKTLSPQPDLAPITSLAFGEGRFVAATEKGLAFSSDNGFSWILSSVNTGRYNALAYANDQFVAVGENGAIQSSPDGVIWMSHSLPVTNTLHAVTYGNNFYVASGAAGLVATSPDAVDWTILPNQTTSDLLYAAFANSRFLLLGPTGSSLVSTNGTNWSAHFPTIVQGAGCRLSKTCIGWTTSLALTSDNDRFVAKYIGRTTYTWAFFGLLTSPDGINWWPAPEAPFSRIMGGYNNLHYAGDLFVEVGARHYSTDLYTWTPFEIPGDTFSVTRERILQSVAYGNGSFVVGGFSAGFATVAVGPDLRQLSQIDRAMNGTASSLAVAGDTIVAISDGILVSTNGGATFDRVELPAGITTLNSVTHLGNYFIAVGADGAILRSGNGINWSRRLSNTSAELTDIAFGNGLFVAVGDNGRIVTSPDSSSFSLRSSGTEIRLNSIAFGDGAFVAVGRSGLITSSHDATNWTSLGTEEAQDLYSVAHGNGRFVATGTNGIVHVSTNLTAWTTTTVPDAPSYSALSRVAFANGRFIALDFRFGQPMGAFISTNGLNWSRLTLPRLAVTVESYDNKFWLGGRYFLAHETAADPSGLHLASGLANSGEITLRFTPETGGTFTIQSVADLSSSWIPVATFTNSASQIIWTDTNTTSRTRFYRVIQN